MSIEWYFRSTKHSRGLEGHTIRGMEKMQLHITFSVVTYLATSLARLQMGQPEKLRRMTVRVA